MNRGPRFRRALVVGGALVLFLACSVWARSLCGESKAGPPGQEYDGQHGWAFYGRELLQGPQALAGTWYNLPGPGGPADDAGDGACPAASAAPRKWKKWLRRAAGGDGCAPDGCEPVSDVGGSWFWLRSPEQERVVVAGLYNRYCIRCHGSNGRGVWDMPGVPDFTNTRWQVTRSDDQIARIIIEGRGRSCRRSAARSRWRRRGPWRGTCARSSRARRLPAPTWARRKRPVKPRSCPRRRARNKGLPGHALPGSQLWVLSRVCNELSFGP